MNDPAAGVTTSRAGAAAVSLRGVGKRYGRTNAVSSVDLEIAPGEFVSMLGPSGSGKTTTLKMIAGFESPDSGTVVFDGEDVTGIPPERRNIGVVFQNYSLFPHLDVGANVAFPLRMRGAGRKEAARKAVEALELVELAGFRSRKPASLSGGQQQRVAIARAIVFEPRLLVMDEPLGALDRRLREVMQFEIKSLHERLGMTVVYVTHDQEEALTMSDSVVVFNQGHVEQQGSPREVYDRPTTAFVADFLGESLSLSAIAGRHGMDAAGIGHIPIPPPPGISDGQRVRIMWRSHAIAVTRPGSPSQPDTLSITARVHAGGYAGDMTKIRVALPTGDEGLVSVPSAGFEYVKDSEIELGLGLSSAVVLPAESASSGKGQPA